MEYKNGITVVVPVYNAEKSLKICVESIISQVYKDWYLILVDDGSTDNSPKICDEYAEKYSNIKVIHKENGGVSSARNTGINVTDTEYLVFVDSDDYVSSDYLQSLLYVKNMYPNIGHVWNTFQTVYDYSLSQCINSENSKIKVYDRSNLSDLISSWYVQGPVCKLYSNNILKQYDIRMDESLSLGEDFLFNLEYLDVAPNDRIAICDNKSYYYYIANNHSLDHKYREDYLVIMQRIQDRVYDYLIKWKADSSQIQKYYNNYFGTYISVFENTFHPENKSSFSKKIKYNNSILKSDKFKQVLDKSNCYINPVVKLGYITNNYSIIYLVEKIAMIKNRRKKCQTKKVN